MACRFLAAGLITAVIAAASTAFAQSAPRDRGGTSVREVGNLVYDNIPAGAVEIREAIRRYQNARSATFQDWLADGSILITTRFAHTAQLHRVATAGGARTQLTYFDEPVQKADAVPSTQRFIYTKDSGGSEYFQGYLAGLDGHQVQITEPGTRNQFFTFSRDGRWVAWSRAMPGNANYDIMLMRADDPRSRRVVLEGQGAIVPIDFSPDGTRLLIGRYISSTESKPYLLDIATGALTEINPGAGEVAYSGGKFAPDGKSLLMLSDEGGDTQRLLRYSLVERGFTSITPANLKWDVEAFDVSRDGKLLAYSVNDDGRSRVTILNLLTGKSLTRPDLPDGVLTGLRFSPDGASLALGLSTAATPGDVWTWSIQDKRLVRWTESELGGIDRSQVTTPQLIRYKAFDGLSIPAFVYRPKGRVGSRLPVIINVHGGPADQARPDFNPYTQYFVNEIGAAVITPNIRGSDGYGKAYLKLDDGLRREDSVKDIGALLDWIRSQPDLDPGRVVVYGGSYGGYMALAALAYYNDRLAGAVDIVGISNWVTFLTNTEGYRRAGRRAEYGDEREPRMREFLDRISPLNMTDKMTKPLLVIQGANDPRVPRTEAEQIVSKLRHQGGEVWYLLAKDEGHGFRKKPNMDGQLEAETLFLRRVFGLAGVGPADSRVAP